MTPYFDIHSPNRSKESSLREKYDLFASHGGTLEKFAQLTNPDTSISIMYAFAQRAGDRVSFPTAMIKTPKEWLLYAYSELREILQKIQYTTRTLTENPNA